MPKCAICDIEIEDHSELKQRMSCHDFIITCKKHKEYSQHYLPELVKFMLFITKTWPDTLKNCGICGNELTTRDKHFMQEKAKDIIRPVCQKHQECYNWFQDDLSKKWFEFKEKNPGLNWYNLHDQKKFYESLKK